MEVIFALVMGAGASYGFIYTVLKALSEHHLNARNVNRGMRFLSYMIRFYPFMHNLRLGRSAILERYYHDYLRSIEDCDYVISKNPKILEAYINRGIAYYRLAQFDKALEDFDMAITIRPDYPLAYLNKADIFLNIYRDCQTAIELCEIGLEYAPQALPFYFLMINAYIELKAFDDAMEVCQHADKNDAHSAHIHILKALILQKRYGLKEAQVEIDKALASGSDESAVLPLLGDIYVYAHEFEKALDVRNRLIEQNPKANMLYSLRGVLYAHLGQYDKALADYNHAIQLNPHQSISYNNRASLLLKQGQYKEALSDVTHCIEREPGLKNAYDTRGEIYFVIGDYDKALADFERAEELRHRDEFALMGQAITYYKLGDIDTAKDRWRHVLEQEPTFTNIGEVIKEFDPPQSFVDAVREVAALT